MATIKVQGMHCGACAGNVTRAITALDPAAQVQVDVAAGQVTVTGGAAEAELREAIRRAGYTPLG